MVIFGVKPTLSMDFAPFFGLSGSASPLIFGTFHCSPHIFGLNDAPCTPYVWPLLCQRSGSAYHGFPLEAGPSLLTGHWEQSTVSRTGSLRPFFWIYFNQPVCAILRFNLICPKISGETSFMAVICPKIPGEWPANHRFARFLWTY